MFYVDKRKESSNPVSFPQVSGNVRNYASGFNTYTIRSSL